MKSSLFTLLMVGSLVVASGCGSSEEENKKENYSYEYTENNCPTGKHEFESKQAYCDGLKNHSLNKNCAYSLRKDAFAAQCSGSFD